jgi:hypothetical protein
MRRCEKGKSGYSRITNKYRIDSMSLLILTSVRENAIFKIYNAMREKYGYDEWRFIEIANDIRDIRNQLKTKIAGI